MKYSEWRKTHPLRDVLLEPVAEWANDQIERRLGLLRDSGYRGKAWVRLRLCPFSHESRIVEVKVELGPERPVGWSEDITPCQIDGPVSDELTPEEIEREMWSLWSENFMLPTQEYLTGVVAELIRRKVIVPGQRRVVS